MAAASALSRCWEIVRLGEIVTFPGSVSGSATKLLPQTADNIVRSVLTLLEYLVRPVIETDTAAAFQIAREEAFPKYAEAVEALASLTHLVAPEVVVDRWNQEFFRDFETNLKQCGLALGEAIRDKATSSACLLNRLSDLVSQVDGIDSINTKQELVVAELIKPCIHQVVRTHFHIHCLVLSLQLQRPMRPEVLELVVDGLRSAVDAYGFAQRISDVLAPFVTPDTGGVECDEEDTELLAEAMRGFGTADVPKNEG